MQNGATAPAGMPWLHAFFEFPLWSAGVLSAADQPRRASAISCERPGARDNFDEGLAEYDYLTTHQPGAQHAPYYFVSGYLFSEDIIRIYHSLTLPVWMCARRARRFCRLQQQDAGGGPRQLDHPGVSDRRDAALRGKRRVRPRRTMRFSPACRRLHRHSKRAMSDLVWSRDGADWPNREASTFVEAAGFRWHVQRMGEGPPLLLIHGTGAGDPFLARIDADSGGAFRGHRAGSARSWLHPIAAVASAVAAGHGVGRRPASARARREARNRGRPFGRGGDTRANVPRRQNRSALAGQPQWRIHAVRRRGQSSAFAAGETAGDESVCAARCLPGRHRMPVRSSG